MAFERDIFHPSRHVPLIYVFTALVENLSAATFLFSLAPRQGASAFSGFPLINAAAGSEGISPAYDSSYVHPATGAVVGATRITVQVDADTLETLTYPTAPDELVVAYDLLKQPSGGEWEVHAFGALTIAQGVTNP